MSDYIKIDERKYWLKCLVDGILGDDGLCEGCKYVDHGTCYQCRRIGANEIIKIIDADVAPVRHGRWIDDERYVDGYYANCSECGWQLDVKEERGYHNYCPNCGARMDGEKNE